MLNQTRYVGDSIIPGIFVSTKEELEDYLRNEMIVLNITLDVAIDLIDKEYGYLVIRKKISSDTE